ncbi:MAG: conjugative transposon protein TraM [Chitinophagaceae bacterium]
MQQISPALRRKRKFLTIVPLLVIPFLTMIFWALGGGQKADAQTVTNANPGLNLQLPDAKFKEGKEIDKMGYYDRAAADSVKLKALMKEDPYYQNGLDIRPDFPSNSMSFAEKMTWQDTNLDHFGATESKYADPNEEKVYQKLAKLNDVLAGSQREASRGSHQTMETSSNPELSAELHQLEKMIKELEGSKSEEDPELAQLNSVLDKIIDVQNPQQSTPGVSKKEPDVPADTVFNLDPRGAIGLIDTTPEDSNDVDGFYNLISEERSLGTSNAIEAVIHENQTLVNGSVVKMRLLRDVFISNAKIPKGTFVYGQAALNNERLIISINSVLYLSHIFQVKMSVYDLDGIAGLFIPGAISRDVVKQSTGNSIQGINLTSLDPSIGMQAANAGIETAKTFLGKKAKLVKVQVRAGHKIFIYDQNFSK